MPTVKQYERQVGLNPIPGVRRQEYRIIQLQTPPTPVAKDTRPIAEFGQVVAQAGESFAAQQLDKQNQIRILAAKNEVERAVNDTLYNPQSGALTVHGEAAAGLMDSVGKTLTDAVGKAREKLSNDVQRLHFDDYVHSTDSQVYETVAKHIMAETAAAEKDHLEAYKVNRSQAALGDPNPRAAELAASDIANEYNRYGDAHGIDKEVTKGAIAQATSDIFVGKLAQYQDRNDDIRAKVYYEEHKDQILPSLRPHIEASLQKQTTLGDAQRITDSIKTKLGKDASLTDLWDEIPKYTQDPEVRKATEEQLKSWNVATREESRLRAEQAAKDQKDRLEKMETQIKNSLDAAPRSLSYDQIVPESTRRQLTEPVEKAGREYWKLLQEGKKVVTDGPTYRALLLKAATSPNDFIKEDMEAYRNKLDDAKLDEVTKLKADIIKGNTKEAEKVIGGFLPKEEMINMSLRSVGIDPKDKANQAAVDAFWKAVASKVDPIEDSSKKPMPQSDIQKIIDQLLVRTPGQAGSWWGLLPGGGPFFDVPPGKPRFLAPPDPVQPMRSGQMNVKPGEYTRTNDKTGEVQVWRGGRWVSP